MTTATTTTTTTMVSSLSERTDELDQRVLTVGDGNFSFSLAYAKRFPRHRLVATVFDSWKTLRERYPEAPRLVAKLLSLSAAARHSAFCGVDATDLSHAAQSACRLSLSSSTSSSNNSSNNNNDDGDDDGDDGDDVVVVSAETPDNNEQKQPHELAVGEFDRVVFNFPHVGIEDIHRHRLLLAHFFAEAQHILFKCNAHPSSLSSSSFHATRSTQCGEIWLTLCGDQPDSWQMLHGAERSGLVLVHTQTFNPTEWIGYNQKRHHTNKAFPLTRPCTFVFAPRCECRPQARVSAFNSPSSSSSSYLKRKREDQPEPDDDKEHSADPSAQQEQQANAKRQKTNLSRDQLKAAKFDGVGIVSKKLVSALQSSSTTTTISPSSQPNEAWVEVTEHICPISSCAKTFSTARGVVSHCINVHRPTTEWKTCSAVDSTHASTSVEPQPQQTQSESGSDFKSTCDVCGRLFADVSAVEQHRKAKHRSSSTSSSSGLSETLSITQPLNQLFPSLTGESTAHFTCPSNSPGAVCVSPSSPPTDWICRLCGVFFDSHSSLVAHKAFVQPIDIASLIGVDTLTCFNCQPSRSFPNPRALQQHTAAVHSSSSSSSSDVAMASSSASF